MSSKLTITYAKNKRKDDFELGLGDLVVDNGVVYIVVNVNEAYNLISLSSGNRWTDSPKSLEDLKDIVIGHKMKVYQNGEYLIKSINT